MCPLTCDWTLKDGTENIRRQYHVAHFACLTGIVATVCICCTEHMHLLHRAYAFAAQSIWPVGVMLICIRHVGCFTTCKKRRATHSLVRPGECTTLATGYAGTSWPS